MASTWLHLLGLLMLCLVLATGSAKPFDSRRNRNWGSGQGPPPRIPTTPPFNPHG
ncbi:uncharacterized protein [Drosophila bipectinata]|uniref:uncharacterized protein n=1 Tax=Drosophila bipectinata TaxID=42026 RepID=UPI0007E82D3A|nr:uncharacterized protein LOC108123510 [Drosophila bipectinata]